MKDPLPEVKLGYRAAAGEPRMYIYIVLLFMAVLPVGSIAVEHTALHASAPLVALAGKWFVFWSMGVRLLTAGLRQIIQPAFTAKTILGIQGDDALVLVQELGFANVAMGLLGCLTLIQPIWTLPAAIVGGAFYALAGGKHITQKNKGFNEVVAMVSDLLMAVVLLGYLAWTVFVPPI